MTDTTVISALIGMAMPMAIAMLNQAYWSPRLKGLVAMLACVVAAALTEWVRGDLDWHDWRGTFVVIAGAALVTYRVWWQPSGIAPVVEVVTTVGGPAVPTDYPR